MGFSKKDIKRAQLRNAIKCSRDDKIDFERPNVNKKSLGESLELKNKKSRKGWDVYGL